MSRIRRALWVALAVVLGYPAFGIVEAVRGSEAARGSEAPYIVRVEKATVAYAPGGTRVDIPAGSEIDICITDEQIVTTHEDGPPTISFKAGIEYDTSGRVFLVTKTCPERPLFADGFE